MASKRIKSRHSNAHIVAIWVIGAILLLFIAYAVYVKLSSKSQKEDNNTSSSSPSRDLNQANSTSGSQSSQESTSGSQSSQESTSGSQSSQESTSPTASTQKTFTNNGTTISYNENDVVNGKMYNEFKNGDKMLSYEDIISGFVVKSEISDLITHIMKSSNYDFFYFETPGITYNNWGTKFEFVLINSTCNLELDTISFKEHFDRANGKQFVSFNSKSNGTLLVSPVPDANKESNIHYKHLSSFIKHVNSDKARELWHEVAEQIKTKMSYDNKVYLSTSGQGVGWLHVRIEDTPKYYSYTPYKS